MKGVITISKKKIALVDWRDTPRLKRALYAAEFPAEEYDVDVVEFVDGEEEALVKALDGYDAWVGSSGLIVKPETVKKLSTVKILALNGTGYNYEMAQAAKECGIAVSAVRAYSAPEVADHTCTLIMALERWICRFNRDVQVNHVWNARAYEGTMTRLAEQTLGIVGLGRIGQGVARRMQGFGMTVIAYDPYLPKEIAEGMGVRLVSLDELLAESDVITTHLNLNPETKDMYNINSFRKMKKKPIFINVSRGGMVVEDDLIQALDEGLIKAAGLDVLCREDGKVDSPEVSRFLGRENVIVTPHCAFFSDTALRVQKEQCTAACKNFLNNALTPEDWIVNDVTVCKA